MTRGQVLRRDRRAAGLTQVQAASRLSWGVCRVRAIEKGRSPLTDRDALQVRAVLGLKLDLRGCS